MRGSRSHSSMCGYSQDVLCIVSPAWYPLNICVGKPFGIVITKRWLQSAESWQVTSLWWLPQQASEFFGKGCMCGCGWYVVNPLMLVGSSVTKVQLGASINGTSPLLNGWIREHCWGDHIARLGLWGAEGTAFCPRMYSCLLRNNSSFCNLMMSHIMPHSVYQSVCSMCHLSIYKHLYFEVGHLHLLRATDTLKLTPETLVDHSS